MKLSDFFNLSMGDSAEEEEFVEEGNYSFENPKHRD